AKGGGTRVARRLRDALREFCPALEAVRLGDHPLRISQREIRRTGLRLEPCAEASLHLGRIVIPNERGPVIPVDLPDRRGIAGCVGRSKVFRQSLELLQAGRRYSLDMMSELGPVLESILAGQRELSVSQGHIA